MVSFFLLINLIPFPSLDGTQANPSVKHPTWRLYIHGITSLPSVSMYPQSESSRHTAAIPSLKISIREYCFILVMKSALIFTFCAWENALKMRNTIKNIFFFIPYCLTHLQLKQCLFDKSVKIGIQKSGASIRTLDVSLRLLMELGYE